MLTRDLPSYRRQGSGKRLFRLTILAIFLVFLFVTLFQGLFIRSYRVQSDSMQPAITPGDMILASPLLYGKEAFFTGGTALDFARPVRGDVVLVEPPYHIGTPFIQRLVAHVSGFFSLGYWKPRFSGATEKTWERSLVVRRVIALPGDQIYGNDGVFYVKAKGKSEFQSEFAASGKKYSLKQPKDAIRDPGMVFSAEMPLLVVPDGSWFVAADNRQHSLDSRHWGPVSANAFRGVVMLGYWPFNRIGWIH